MELKKKNTIAIIQARVSSKRFPNKVLQKIGKKKIIDIIVERLKKSKKIHKIVIAIPKNKENLQLKNYLVKKNIIFFRKRMMFCLDIILLQKNLKQNNCQNNF